VRVPSSTYRVQFNGAFRFVDGTAILAYLDKLGISDIYSSPILKAQHGSMHGYDVTDPTQINPEIGTREEFERFASEIKKRRMGLILDIVPNHMAASLENPWWTDVLANGASSRFANFFDVDWSSDKIILPILAKPYGECLESGEFALKRDNGSSRLRYFDHELPVRVPQTVEVTTVDDLDRLISAQPYRLAFWRKAADSINYRRFFDVNDLVGIRAERDDVFKATHETVFGFIDDGLVDGLRIDHIDGLLDPDRYLQRLPHIYVVVEKILGGNETIPPHWRTHGTTGYDFTAISQNVFIDPEGFRRLQQIYAEFTGNTASLLETFRTCKRKIMEEIFAGELTALSNRLVELAEPHRHARDLSQRDLHDALLSVTSCLPVYRTYIRDFEILESDRCYIEEAILAAGCKPLCAALEFVRNVLLIQPPYYLEHQRRDYLEFVRQWQQFTGPVMAKGLEDTAFYRYNALVSTNEVGRPASGPEAFLGVDEFHRRNIERQHTYPYTMNASSTHDTKRSEDVRARIDVLSELPDEWESRLKRWSRWNPSDSAPDANEQVLIYQTLLGAWPISRERLQGYLIKALREAKAHTSWMQNDGVYEQEVLSFVDRLMDPDQSRSFLKNFFRFHKKISFFGAMNSLSRLLLKLTSPGVPDIYQGTELWDFSLTDPDNRRPVDYENRVHALEWIEKHGRPKELLRWWQDGRIKMFVLWKSLTFRREHAEVFMEGEYLPIEVSGRRAENVIAFARHLGDKWILVVVPRLMSQLTKAGTPALGRVWADTVLQLPPQAPHQWRNVFTGKAVSTSKLAHIFSELPFALLERAT